MQSIDNMPGEEWRPLVKCPEAYEVSNKGRIRSISRDISYFNHGTLTTLHKEGQLIKQRIDDDGYMLMTGIYAGKPFGQHVHRSVAEAFIPNPDNKPTVNHIDGNKLNNDISNLEWATYKEQNDHAVRLGLRTAATYQNTGKVTAEKTSIKVRCIETGVEYCSMIEAERQLNLWWGAVSTSISRGSATHGYHFEKVDDKLPNAINR